MLTYYLILQFDEESDEDTPLNMEVCYLYKCIKVIGFCSVTLV